MPPKYKFTKEEITNAALNIARIGGMSAVTARSVAFVLESSPKIIFSVFENMNELHNEITKKATDLYKEYISTDMQKDDYPPYKASGMAYIRFAKEETELFKLLFMCERTEEQIKETDLLDPIIEILTKSLGITEEEATLLHLEMWTFVHGIATMIATNFLQWDTEHISNMMSDVYSGLKLRFANKETRK